MYTPMWDLLYTSSLDLLNQTAPFPLTPFCFYIRLISLRKIKGHISKREPHQKLVNENPNVSALSDNIFYFPSSSLLRVFQAEPMAVKKSFVKYCGEQIEIPNT